MIEISTEIAIRANTKENQATFRLSIKNSGRNTMIRPRDVASSRRNKNSER